MIWEARAAEPPKVTAAMRLTGTKTEPQDKAEETVAARAVTMAADREPNKIPVAILKESPKVPNPEMNSAILHTHESD